MKQFHATLVRGKHYSLGMTSWKQGDTVVISEEQKTVLERDAVHVTHTDDGEKVTRQQFKFVEIEEAPKPQPAAPANGSGGGGGGNRQRTQGQGGGQGGNGAE